MDVRLPDGTIIQNVPDGTTKAQLTEKLKANGYDVSKLGAAPEPQRGAAALSGVNRGIAQLLGLPVDTAENLVNLGIAGAGSAATALGRPDLAPDVITGTPGGSESIARAMGKVGIGTSNPSPEDRASRLLYTGGAITGGSLVPGSGVKSTLAAAGGGALANEFLGPEWTGVGAMLPAAAGQAATAAKNAVANRVAENQRTFREAGTEPSLGQATRNSFFQGLENLASKFPGGAGVMRRFVEGQQRQIGEKLSTGVSAEDAGRAIERGTTGFLARTKQVWQSLDEQVAAKIPQDARFTPSNTVQTLDKLTAPVEGAEKTTASLVNPKVAAIRENIAADLKANNGVMPYQALRELRTRVGSMIDDSLVSGVPQGELKALYGALSKDLETAANAAGAGQEFARQNNYYRSRMDRVEGTLQRVLGNTPEETFSRFMPKDAEQANKVRSVMRSLDPEQRQTVTNAVVSRLGRATPGRQNEVGDVFSSETFLTNWNRMSDGAKAQLFPDAKMRSDLNHIAKAAANIREGTKVFQNTSGTAGSFAAYSVYASPIASLATGSPAPMVAAGGAAGSAYIGARMLTSPKVVDWLSKPVNPAQPGAAAAHLARLAVIYNQTKDPELKDELSRFVSAASQPSQ